MSGRLIGLNLNGFHAFKTCKSSLYPSTTENQMKSGTCCPLYCSNFQSSFTLVAKKSITMPGSLNRMIFGVVQLCPPWMCSKENLSVWICLQWRVSGYNSQSLVIFGHVEEMVATQSYSPTDVAKLMNLNIVKYLNGIRTQCINALQVY